MTSKLAKRKLSPELEVFCQLYASNVDYFGNGTYAYAKAFNKDLSKRGVYSTCAVSANRLLKKDNVLGRIDEILDLYLNDQFVDKQLAFLITQNAELGTKLGAIKEYNALKKRVQAPQNNVIVQILAKYGIDARQTSGTED